MPKGYPGTTSYGVCPKDDINAYKAAWFAAKMARDPDWYAKRKDRVNKQRSDRRRKLGPYPYELRRDDTLL